MTDQRLDALTHLALRDFSKFSRAIVGLPLRPYQIEPAQAILESIRRGWGLTFVIEMSRQAGKNELSAQLEAYLLTLAQRRGGNIVKASPTFKPQTLNSLNRLKERLHTPWHRISSRSGYVIQLNRAAAYFFSAEPRAQVVGATASLLLEGDEAQDIALQKWQKDFEPMRASTNATLVFWGTAWTSSTLLAQAKADGERLQQRDGRRRVFLYDAAAVAQHLPAYAEHVTQQVEKLGRNHPLIKTQYYLEDIDDQTGLFPAARRALLHGTHPRTRAPEPLHTYHLLIDVAGEDENAADQSADRADLRNPKRDAVAVTIVEEIQPNSQSANSQSLYLIRDQHLFIGIKHTTLYQRLVALAEHWQARYLVVDATGVGAGLTSFLQQRFTGDRVIPFEFSTVTKSDLGWDLIALVETGRLKMYADDDSPEARQFWYEVEHCELRVHPGPGHRISWGVTETPAYDGLIARGHDDLLISAALTAIVDKQPRPTPYSPAHVQPEPPKGIKRRGKF